MEVLEVRDGFGLDRLALGERPEAEPDSGQIRLRLAAASINYRDLMMVRGEYNPRQPLPLIPCSDGVGVVEAVGPGVARVAAGDRVATLFNQRWFAGTPDRAALRATLGGPLPGTLTERMILDAEGVTRVPEHLSNVEAASLPCAGVTAWNAVVGLGRVKAGDTVLVQGTGGVAVFALQFAQLSGARTIVLSGSDEKLEMAQRLGAWETVNYRVHPEWGREVVQRNGGEGVDIVVDVGGAGTLEQSLRAVRPGGQVAVIGVLSGGLAQVDLAQILMRQVRLQGVFVGHRESFEAMNRAIAVHRLRPAVGRVLPWREARAALELMAAGKHFGKIALTFD
jgi:NADPH:quinone reductase-like Zn-dependent oxidoreductase